MNLPLVSVVIPTYKRPEYLALTLKSVTNQSYKNLEIIVVDDGTEGDINKRVCDSFDTINYLKITNSGGPATPRNHGIRAAKGEFIAFVDDDDIWLSNKIERQVALLLQHKEYGLIHGPCLVIDEHGQPTQEIVGRPGSPEVKHGDVKLRMMGNWTLMMPTPLIRKEVIDAVGLFNENMPAAGEDAEFWVRCSFTTLFYYLDQPLVHYRKHSSNISSDRKKYARLPLYLNQVRKAQLNNGAITNSEGRQLLRNLSSMQLKMVKFHKVISFKNMFCLDALWFLKGYNLKLLAKLLT